MNLNGAPVTAPQLATLGLVGYGHFTSMRVEHGAVRGLNLHMDRLRRDCAQVFDTELDTGRVRDLVRESLPADGAATIVRVTVFDPKLELARPGAAAHPQILVTTRNAPPTPQGPLTLQSAVFRRDMPRIKHTGLFASLHHRALAQRAGADDVLFSEPDGTISEIATSNIGFIDTAGRLIWPDAEVLIGTTMQLIDRARDADVLTEKITLAEVDQFAAVVATNAAVGVRPVSAIDDRLLPIDNDLIAALRQDYESIPPQQL
ncbi:aminotransferase class IV [Nocardia brasiliensis]|uniref:aminotransferase class IV n=1 Tax=Nocardia brasiliensis TaxID=37326 RepID=UPI002458F682|nr:aminotransferase class IV [Nocardia brasiliensis]